MLNPKRKSPSPEIGVLLVSASISAARIDDILPLLATPPTLDIVAEHFDRASLPSFIDARAMGRDDHIRHIPKWAFAWQRLGFEHIERRPPQAAVPKALEESRVPHDPTPRNIDENGAAFHPLELRPAEKVVRPGREWEGDEHDIGFCEHIMELVWAGDIFDISR